MAATGSGDPGSRKKIPCTENRCARYSSTEAARIAPPPMAGYGASAARNSAFGLVPDGLLPEALDGVIIHGSGKSGCLAPRKFSGSEQSPFADAARRFTLLHGRSQGIHPAGMVADLEQQGAIACYFQDRRIARGQHQRPALHGFEHRQTEPFIVRRIETRDGVGVKSGEILFGR